MDREVRLWVDPRCSPVLTHTASSLFDLLGMWNPAGVTDLAGQTGSHWLLVPSAPRVGQGHAAVCVVG